MDLNEIDAWTVSQRRATALRLLGAGLALLLPTLAYLALVVDWQTAEVITRDRAVAVMLGVIGACLTVVGVHALAGVRRGIEPAVPTATARTP
ncbi:MAG: hypothetical protein IPH44_34850 [Myxococcales bacterium]|nr:hypothetical protein [Myxococcales bacterium]MBK7197390.1 hypothetical protein [Myxococcales bacterium]MBP6845780.1 hypothetical protein [Kofleriaceae bacterium]